MECRRAWRPVAALAAALGALAAAQGEDAAALLQTGALAARREDCECLNYADVYGSGKAECGMGLEEFRVLMHEALPCQWTSTLGDAAAIWKATREGSCSWRSQLKSNGGMDNEDCDNFTGIPNSAFFPKQRHNYCMKANPFARQGSSLYATNWCYVSSRCGSLNGGVKINGEVSWKVCQQGKDKLLGDLPLKKLCAFAKAVDPVQFARYGTCQIYASRAYPFGGSNWQQTAMSLANGQLDIASIRGPTFWNHEKADTYMVVNSPEVWELYGETKSWRTPKPGNGTFHCAYGCPA